MATIIVPDDVAWVAVLVSAMFFTTLSLLVPTERDNTKTKAVVAMGVFSVYIRGLIFQLIAGVNWAVVAFLTYSMSSNSTTASVLALPMTFLFLWPSVILIINSIILMLYEGFWGQLREMYRSRNKPVENTE